MHKQYRRDLVLYQRNRHQTGEAMDFQKLTLKSQEAIAAAQELARRNGNPEIAPEHLTLALLDQELPRTLVERAGASAARAARAGRGGACAEAVRAGRRSSSRASRPRSRKVLDKAEEEMRRLEDEFVSTEHLLLALDVVPRDALAGGAAGGARRPARHVAESGGLLPGAREVRPRPDRAGRERQARPGDRPRRGDPPRHPGAVAPHQEQPGADRRARHRQDGDRRRPRAAHRRRRRPRRTEGQARVGARPRRRCSPARSTAASSRSG